MDFITIIEFSVLVMALCYYVTICLCCNVCNYHVYGKPLVIGA